jgi:universal stress protein E
MNTIRRILIVAPASLSITPAVERGMTLAKTIGAEVWLGWFDAGRRAGWMGSCEPPVVRRLEKGLRADANARLRALADAIQSRYSLMPHVVVDRRLPLSSTIVAQVARLGVDLVLKDAERDTRLQRLLLVPLDWELTRACSVPFWLVNLSADTLPQTMIAAVDATHPEHGAGGLNEAILGAAKEIRDAAHARLSVCSVFADLPFDHFTKDPQGLGVEWGREAAYGRLREQYREAFEVLMRRHRISSADSDLLFGPVREQLRKHVAARKPALVILGTLHRRGVERLFLGSTVEHRLVRMHCDVLVVPRSAPAKRRVPASRADAPIPSLGPGRLQAGVDPRQ